MRNIKFRVWDNIDYMSKPFTLHDLQAGNISFSKESPIMQYTGIKDKNGVEIYEGDVVQFGVGEKESRVVHWCEGEFRPLSSFCVREDHCVPIEEMTVIGNVYENPELVKAP